MDRSVTPRTKTGTEGCGKSHFKFSRPPEAGAPYGPMWRALMAALPVAHAFLDRAECDPRSLWGGIGNRAEAVADILIIARSREFQRCCKELDLGSKAH